jgi:hypothetical protein
MDKSIDIFCPNCGELFNSEKKMLEHYHLTHEEILQEDKINQEPKKQSEEYVLGYIGNAFQGMGMSTLTLFFTMKNIIVAKVVGSGVNIAALLGGGSDNRRIYSRRNWSGESEEIWKNIA